MPRRAGKYVPRHRRTNGGGGVLGRGNRRRGAGRPTAAARGYDHRWRAYVAAYLSEPANFLCACGCGRGAEVVDHIKPVSGPADPLFWTPSNHQPLTRACHSRKTATEDGGFGNRKARR